MANRRMLGVESIGDIRKNRDTLFGYRNSEKHKAFFESTIKNRTCFLPFRMNGELVFSPSRFIGYKNNTETRHHKNDLKNGTETNQFISKIIGVEPKADVLLEEEYKRFCKRISITVNSTGSFGNPRKYWPVDGDKPPKTKQDGDLDGQPAVSGPELERRTRAARKRMSQGPAQQKPKGQQRPATVSVTSDQYLRDPQVKAWVLENSRGVCEACDAKGPFLNDHDEPFLEVHHVEPLADGGADTINNAIAVCPNCHRRFHHSKDRVQFRAQVVRKVSRLSVQPRSRKDVQIGSVPPKRGDAAADTPL